MGYDEQYESWKKQRATVAVPGDFADRVMASVHARKIDFLIRPRGFAGLGSPSSRSRTRTIMSRAILAVVAAVVFACVWLGISRFATDGRDTAAFAQTVEQIEKAKSITWKTTFYLHVTSKDGTRTWLKTEVREHAYKAPGLYRETFFDENGHVREVEIADSMHGKRLRFFPGTKTATLSEPVDLGDPAGPFEWAKEELKKPDLQLVKTRKTATGEVNVFRHASRDKANGRDWSDDFWIDQQTKQLVELHIPGFDIYDPETDPARNNPPDKDWATTCPGSVERDIVYNANLDDSLFRLEPPEGYTVTIEHRGQVTEKETIDYLGILADFNDKTFPDQVLPFDISSDRVNKAWDKPEKDRTPAEQKLVETKDHYTAKFYRMPTSLFVQDHAVENSFRYLGKGVKLGDKDRIVCWYKLKDAKDPSTYRVVYGDLSVKDVAAKDLPLPVGP